MRFWRRALLVAAALALLLTLVAAVCRVAPHPSLNNQALSTAYYDRNGQLLRLTLATDDAWRLWTPLEAIADDAVKALLLHEDRYFYYHCGFNPFSLARGAWVSYVRGGHPQGGSTLTMQLARLHWRLNTRSVRGKLTQILRALQLELFYSKRDILEAYLNKAPYGRNINGIGAASLIYFHKEAADLTLPEALTLAVLPQSPSYRIDKTTRRVGVKLRRARDGLLARWRRVYPVDPLLLALFDLPLTLHQPEDLPFIAPHFVEQLAARAFAAGQRQSRVQTTLDVAMQRLLTTQIEGYTRRHAAQGMTNAAGLIVDQRDMSVVAAVGSAGYFNDAISGQINGANIKRSPGSTLKPFIYALALDQGLIHPMTILKDVASSFSSYTPENADHTFVGPLSATQALVRSRNVPAVYLNSRLRRPGFYGFLQQAGISRMRGEAHYGLALALGGGEVTMQEMARLYAMLAAGGVMRELRLRQEDTTGAGRRLFSAEAAFMTLDMLSHLPRSDGAAAEVQKIPIYWKTGTSWGFRDAWSVGLVGDYVLVIWLGNFDYRGNPAFVGANSAAPLFFNVVNALQASYPLRDVNRKAPARLRRVNICLASGNLTTVWCQRQGTTWFIPGVSPITVDTVYRPVYFDPQSKQPICPEARTAASPVEVYEYYDSDIREIFARAGLPKRIPPDPGRCQQGQGNALDTPPLITSPLRHTVYTIEPDKVERNRIVLSATSAAGVQQLYWFVDNIYLGSTAPAQSLYWQPERGGRFELSVIDDHGRAQNQRVDVTLTSS